MNAYLGLVTERFAAGEWAGIGVGASVHYRPVRATMVVPAIVRTGRVPPAATVHTGDVIASATVTGGVGSGVDSRSRGGAAASQGQRGGQHYDCNTNAHGDNVTLSIVERLGDSHARFSISNAHGCPPFYCNAQPPGGAGTLHEPPF